MHIDFLIQLEFILLPIIYITSFNTNKMNSYVREISYIFVYIILLFPGMSPNLYGGQPNSWHRAIILLYAIMMIRQ